MRKARLCLHVTLLEDSRTLSYFVESNTDDGRWELWSEGESLPLSALSVAAAELGDLLSETTAAWSSSSSPSSR